MSFAVATTCPDRFNAHLTLNILNTIQGCLCENDPETALQIIAAYSNILKETLIKPHQTTTVGKEIEIIREYLLIERVRFRQSPQVMIEVPDKLLNEILPKSLLFGLFENAVKHGLRNLGEPGFITIRGIADPARKLLITNNAPAQLNGFDHGQGLKLAEQQIAEFNENLNRQMTLKRSQQRIESSTQLVTFELIL